MNKYAMPEAYKKAMNKYAVEKDGGLGALVAPSLHKMKGFGIRAANFLRGGRFSASPSIKANLDLAKKFRQQSQLIRAGGRLKDKNKLMSDFIKLRDSDSLRHGTKLKFVKDYNPTDTLNINKAFQSTAQSGGTNIASGLINRTSETMRQIGSKAPGAFTKVTDWISRNPKYTAALGGVLLYDNMSRRR